MHLTKLELQGFKTFAKKTELRFLSPVDDHIPITTVVGPNGSGKSNLADAIRWVLGEQSLKLLRGKKTEDVIFSGSDGRSRAGFAEVSITFNNEDRAMPIDYTEVTITRRLFRDGSSEYLLNDAKVRLSDIQLLLAQANVGQRSYSVIGQGMIDHILVSTPEERKAFFDDATGVKQFQIKRHESILKLKRTLENLADVEMLLREIEPRLRSLKRQASRLEKRTEVEQELHSLEEHYYGFQWWGLLKQLDEARQKVEIANTEIKQDRKKLQELETQVARIEQADAGEDTGLQDLQKSYRDLQRKRDTLRTEQFNLEKEIELSKVRAQSHWAPLPLLKIVEEVSEIVEGLKYVKSLNAFKEIMDAVEKLVKRSSDLRKKLQRPNPEDIKPDPKLVENLKTNKKAEELLIKQLTDFEQQIDQYTKKEKTVRAELIDIQRTLREKQQQIHLLENRRNTSQIDLARFEERQQNLLREMDEYLKERAINLRTEPKNYPPVTDQTYPEIQRLRYRLELIGGIDPETIKEYEETRERNDFLAEQVDDLQKAIKSTEKIIKELDEQIEKQSKRVFASINKEFQRYFKILFGGGTCALVKVTKDDIAELEETPATEGVTPERAFTDTGEEQRDKEDLVADKLLEHEQHVVGVDIQATPPGKRMKALNLLSGGERALTSIALVSAIMAVNPSPFVVLDEVDAALDESNTMRFAAILEELSRNSQFIVVTHNRATMEKADVLYGVTMGEEGISNLLSVHLEDITKNGTTRR